MNKNLLEQSGAVVWLVVNKCIECSFVGQVDDDLTSDHGFAIRCQKRPAQQNGGKIVTDIGAVRRRIFCAQRGAVRAVNQSD